MELPTVDPHLQQVLCALQWMKKGILHFCKRIAPLHDFMKRFYLRIGTRTKVAVVRSEITTLGLSDLEQGAFQA